MTFFRITPDRDRPEGFPAFSIFGIRVYIEFGFLLFIGLIFFLNADGGQIDVPLIGIFCLAVFFSILAHEFGHALSSKAFGCDPIVIGLRMFGGYTRHRPTTPGKSLVIIAMGPGVGFVLAGIATWLYFSVDRNIHAPGLDGAWNMFLLQMMWVNWVWSFFNLIPIFPMDGGMLVLHALSFKLDHNRALFWTARVSLVFCVLTGVVVFQLGFGIAAFFCLFFFMDNLNILKSMS